MKRSARILFFSLAAGIGAAVLLLHGSLAYWAARWSARETLEAFLAKRDIYQEYHMELAEITPMHIKVDSQQNIYEWKPCPMPGHWTHMYKARADGPYWGVVAQGGRYIIAPGLADAPCVIYDAAKDADMGIGGYRHVYLLLTAGGGILLYSLGGLSIYALYRRFSPPKSAAAQVLEIKDCDYSQVIVGHYGLLNRRDTVVLFQVEGTVLGLFCGQELCEALEKGADGLLTYRGTRALSFLRDGGKAD